jgi:hypothetical protein
LSQLSPYVSINTKSQQLFYSDLEKHQPLIKTSDDKTRYFLNSNDLSVVTNIIESRVGSHQTDSSTINFISYVPAKQPLYIVNEQTGRQLDSFVVPRWGGVHILNHLSENSDIEMKTFLTQFLQIIGIDMQQVTFQP